MTANDWVKVRSGGTPLPGLTRCRLLSCTTGILSYSRRCHHLPLDTGQLRHRPSLAGAPQWDMEKRAKSLADETVKDVSQRYKMHEELGAGAQATVYRATHRKNSAKVQSQASHASAHCPPFRTSSPGFSPRPHLERESRRVAAF